MFYLLFFSTDYTYLTNYEGPLSQSDEYLNCEIVASSKSLIASPIAFIMTKNSSFRDLFNFHLKSLVEKGIYDKLAFYYRSQRPGKRYFANHSYFWSRVQYRYDLQLYGTPVTFERLPNYLDPYFNCIPY